MPVLALNKKIRFDYEILEKFEAGLVLTGQEVKSVRNKQASLKGAYVTINKDKEAFLLNATISAYKMAGDLKDYEPTRSRKLLLNKKEINYLNGKTEQSGLTIVAISLYTKNNKIKLELGLAKGKKKVDKRHDIKKREEKRNIDRLLKQRIVRG